MRGNQLGINGILDDMNAIVGVEIKQGKAESL